MLTVLYTFTAAGLAMAGKPSRFLALAGKPVSSDITVGSVGHGLLVVQGKCSAAAAEEGD